MLKIYHWRIKYEIHNENKKVKIATDSGYAIENECDAINKTVELGAYTSEAHKAYAYSSELKQKKKGRTAYFYGWPTEVYLREWKAPDAKLVLYITYEETDCSLTELMKLPSSDVIAYLKQEGICLVTPS